MKSLKKALYLSFFLLVTAGFLTTQQSCKTKEGCPTNEYTSKTDKKGNFKSGRSSSNLFPKKMRKSVKKKKG